jgi:hypothetical protein
MTAQKSVSIDFSEIPALTVTCKGCKGQILLPLPSPRHTLERKMDCPSCGKRLWENADDPAFRSVDGFARALSLLKEAPHNTISLGFTLVAAD